MWTDGMAAPNGRAGSRAPGSSQELGGSQAPLEEPELQEEEVTQAPGQDAMLRKAQEFFQTCDTEGKGFISRQDLQRLHQELPLSLAELEAVFRALDVDGDGFLTPEEFTTGFSHFFRQNTLSRAGSGVGLGLLQEERVYQSPGDGGDTGQDEEAQFRRLMDKLGAQKLLEDDGGLRQLWLRLRREPHLLSGLEDFLSRIFSQLQEAQEEKSELEGALQRKIAAYDDDIQQLYEEMEQQIQKEREQFLLKDTERFQARSQELERQLLDKEQELERLREKQHRLEGQCAALQSDSHERSTENARLKLSNQELAQELDRTGRELLEAQTQLESLQQEACQLHREKDMEVYRVTESLQREKSGLLKQLDFLRERNKHLRDERDAHVQRDEASRAKVAAVSRAGWKQRSGSVIGKYLEVRGLLRSQSEEDEDVFGLQSRRRSSLGLSGLGVTEEELGPREREAGGPPPRKPLGRIISIEEDPLPQLLEGGFAQLSQCAEEEEEEEEKEEAPGLMGSPRAQPVGKEALSKDERPPGAPDRLFKVVLVGDSAVGKTSLLQTLCQQRCAPGVAATVGIDYRVKTLSVDGSRVALQLWDTAGQERYRCVTRQFFRKADGVVVVYDLTAQRSFLSVRQWLSGVEDAVGGRVPVLLLANKLDQEKEREVPRGHGEKLAKEKNLIFYECSAYSGHNTTESLLHLARVLKEQEDLVKEDTVKVASSAKKKACCA
ncbi:EF-hand calcium-binding domain-containing protein 4B [Thomomys bottae]